LESVGATGNVPNLRIHFSSSGVTIKWSDSDNQWTTSGSDNHGR